MEKNYVCVHIDGGKVIEYGRMKYLGGSVSKPLEDVTFGKQTWFVAGNREVREGRRIL